MASAPDGEQRRDQRGHVEHPVPRGGRQRRHPVPGEGLPDPVPLGDQPARQRRRPARPREPGHHPGGRAGQPVRDPVRPEHRGADPDQQRGEHERHEQAGLQRSGHRQTGEHGGDGEHGQREQHPRRHQTGRGQHRTDRRDRVAGPHQQPALHHAAGGRTAGQHPARGVPRELGHHDDEPGLGAQRDPQQRPERGEAGELGPGHHEEPPRRDVTEARHRVEQGQQAGRDDVQGDGGEEQPGTAGHGPAPPRPSPLLLLHPARISATSARTSPGVNSIVASPTESSTTRQPGSSVVNVFGQVHRPRSTAIRRMVASSGSASPRR